MSQTQISGARRPVRHFRILRPLTLTVMLALAGCTSSQWAGSQASGADPSKLTPEQNEAALIKVADQTRAGGDLGTAVTIYKRAHEMANRDPVPLAKLAETLVQMQAYNDAVEVYRAALALKDDDADLHRGLGNVLLALGKPQLAQAQLEAAAAKSPSDARVYNGLGVAYDLTGRHDLAQQAYRKGLGLAPEQLSLRNNLGLSQALGGDYAGGIATLSEVVTQPGASARNRQNLALVYGLSGDNVHAASVARRDLDEQAVRSNLAYYALLRSLDDVGRTAAILGADVRAAKLNEPAATVKDPAIADAPAAAPMTPVQGQSLQNPQPAAAADLDQSAVINLTSARPAPAAPATPALAPVAAPKVSAAKPVAPIAKVAAAPAQPVSQPAPQVAAQPAPKVAALPQPAPTPAPQVAASAAAGPDARAASRRADPARAREGRGGDAEDR